MCRYHKGFDPLDLPHKEIITEINCKSCHQDAYRKHTFHPWMGNAPLKEDCRSCHDYHYASVTRGERSTVGGIHSVNQCGKCHVDEGEQFLQSEHYGSLIKTSNANSPGCNYCHREPITKGWGIDYSKRKQHQNRICYECHSLESTNRNVEIKISNLSSRHYELMNNGVEYTPICTDCHGYHNIKNNNDFNSRLNQRNAYSACGKCHIHTSQEYQNSVHGMAQLKGNQNAANCVNCHSEHSKNNVPIIDGNLLKSHNLKLSSLMKSNAIYCISCHVDNELMSANNLKTIADAHQFLPSMEKHFEVISCFDCHSSFTESYLSHNILPFDKTKGNCNPCYEKILN